MRKTARTATAAGVATGALVIGGATAFACFSPSGTVMGTSSGTDDQATATRTAETDDTATPTTSATAPRENEESQPEATFSTQQGTRKTVTFEPDQQGDRESAMHSQGNGRFDPDDRSGSTGQAGTAPAQSTGDRDMHGDRESGRR